MATQKEQIEALEKALDEIKKTSPKKSKKSHMDFSKKLAIMITVIFALTWIVGWGTWILKGYLPNELLDYISMPFSVVISGYFAKAGVENYTKIKTNNEEIDPTL